MDKQFTFSVFTPTYNRRHLLHRAYESLLAQTFKDFEWIIIDDGSTDGTEELVKQWQQQAPFPIQYYWQPNQGKHIAYNHVAKYVTGLLFTSIDSDDGVKPNWLERFIYYWSQFSEKEKKEIAGVMCQAENQHGKLIGEPFPEDIMDGDFVDLLCSRKLVGDKGGFVQTHIFKANPYPEDVKNVYVPESYFIHAISQKYKLRWVNEILIVPWTDDRADHLSLALKKNRNYAGSRYGVLAFAKFSMRLFFKYPKMFITNTIFFVRYSAHLKKGIATQWKEIGNGRGRLLWVCVLPVGYALFVRDKLSNK